MSRPLGRRGGGKRILRLGRAGGGYSSLRLEAPADQGDKSRQPENLHLGEARYQTDRHKHHRAEKDCLRLGEELVDYVLSERLVVDIADACDDYARRNRNEQRGDLRHKTVADCEDAVFGDSPADFLAVHEDADANAADDVDGGHYQAGYGVALHEFHGTIHGAVELGFLGQLVAALFRRILIYRAGSHVGINRHLLAGHCIKSEARGNLGNTLGAFGDDDKLHDCDDKEDHCADDEVSADDEVAERVNDFTGIRLEKNKSSCRNVQRQTEQRSEQQHRREG